MELQKSLTELSLMSKESNCMWMIFDDTFQVTDNDTETSYDFTDSADAIQYFKNKIEYIDKQNNLTKYCK